MKKMMATGQIQKHRGFKWKIKVYYMLDGNANTI